MISHGQLYKAVRSNRLLVVRLLAKAGADVNARDSLGQTPLFSALDLRRRDEPDPRMVKLLIEAGADVTIRNNYGQSALDLAESPEMRQLLIRAWPQDDFHLLHTLVKMGLIDEISNALANSAAIDAHDENGRTPLLQALSWRKAAAAKLLVKTGADVTISDNNGQNAMDLARSPEMRELLASAWPQDHSLRLHVLTKADLADEVADAVAAGADVNARDANGWPPLFWAIKNDSQSIVEVLVEAGADVTIRDNDGQSTMDRARSREMRELLARAWPQDHSLRLHALAKADLADEVADAVTAGADVNARDTDGQTPLFWAILRLNLAATQALIEVGADVTARDDDSGQSTLDRARTPEMHQLLARAWPQYHPLRLHALAAADLADEVADAVAAGADVNARDEQGRTPLFWAAEWNCLAATATLIRAGADVAICNNYTEPPMYVAESSEVLGLLARAWPQDHPLRLHALAAADLADEIADAVAAGADVNARDQKGWTPLIWACQKDSLAAAEVLFKTGADVNAHDDHDIIVWVKSSEMRELIKQAPV